ncbi:hypothetical protein HQ487_01570 [Candidatus Uhrbacteria bacterium]|nr:hypothetical protein [Candidatus Uhrbacteria bacterium]
MADKDQKRSAVIEVLEAVGRPSEKVDFETLLREHSELLEKIGKDFTWAQAGEKTALLIKNESKILEPLNESIHTVYERIAHETNVANAVEGIILFEDLVDWDKLVEKHEVTKKGEFNMPLYYDHVTKKTNVGVGHFRPAAILPHLAYAAFQNSFPSYALHELTHKKQNEADIKFLTRIRFYVAHMGEISGILSGSQSTSFTRGEIALTEVQAYRMQGFLSSDYNVTASAYPKDSYSFLTNVINERHYGVSEKDKVIVGTRLFDSLTALGVGQDVIAQLIKKATWNSKDVTYASLEKVVNDEMQAQGIDALELDHLIDGMRLKKWNDILRIKLIAREELEKLIETLALES